MHMFFLNQRLQGHKALLRETMEIGTSVLWRVAYIRRCKMQIKSSRYDLENGDQIPLPCRSTLHTSRSSVPCAHIQSILRKHTVLITAYRQQRRGF
jgi:hypothetical protein